MKLAKFINFLNKPIDVAPLVTFRVAFASLLLWDIYRYFKYDWIYNFYLKPDFLFKYYGFSWVEPLPGNGMYYVFGLLAICCVLILFGLFYRFAIITFTLGFTYIFLLDQSRYLNHFYLVIIFSTLLCFIPANRNFSLDNRFFSKNPHQSTTAPNWTLWVVILQLEIILIYAGLVKLNPDWLQLEPLRMWLDGRNDLPIVGQLFQYDWAIAVAAYGVIALHLIGAPLLLWKRTRLTIFFIYCAFHVLNHFVFSIGIFPWLTIAATTLMFAPSAHRKLWNTLFLLPTKHKTPELSVAATNFNKTFLLSFFFIWFSVQIFFPLRHYIYPGDVAWNEEGHRFAWRMKLRSKKSRAQFSIEDSATGQRVKINRSEFLSSKQSRLVPCHPDLLIQFAHYLDEVFTQRGFIEPKVYLSGRCSLNGRESVRFVSPDLDLSSLQRNLKHNDWILPLEIPLEQRRSGYQRAFDMRPRTD